MTGALRTVYRYWALILFIAIVVQIFFAGLGIFGVVSDASDHKTITEDSIDSRFDAHGALGFFLGPGFLLLFLFALGARLGRNRVLLSLVPVLLWFLQEALVSDVRVVGAFHPVNGVLILGFVGFLAHRAWRRWTDLGESAEMRDLPAAT